MSTFVTRRRYFHLKSAPRQTGVGTLTMALLIFNITYMLKSSMASASRWIRPGARVSRLSRAARPEMAPQAIERMHSAPGNGAPETPRFWSSLRAALARAAACGEGRRGPFQSLKARHDPQRPPSVQLRPRRERRDDPRQRQDLRREGDRAARRRDRPRQPFSARSVAQDGRARPAWDHGAGGLWRA